MTVKEEAILNEIIEELDDTIGSISSDNGLAY